MRSVLPLSLCLLLVACNGSKKSEDASSAASDAPPVATKAPAKPVVKKKAGIGPKTTAASFLPTSGGVVVKDEFQQRHFNLITGKVNSDFAPTKIKFNLYSSGLKDAYPKVKLMVLFPGADWGKDWLDLGDVVVKDEVEQVFDLKQTSKGTYTFRVNYNATEPKTDGRPVLVIRSVELIK